jgi:Tol biopolymer transport system component
MAEHKENPLLHRAISLANSGRVEDAHALLHKIISEDPADEMAWLWLVQTEPDHAQRIQILEECLRHIPNSEYARKGLAGLRTGPLDPAAVQARARAAALRPKKGTGPLRRAGCRWRALLLMGASAGILTVVIAGVLFYPQWKGLLPEVNLPAIGLPFGPRTASPTEPAAEPTVASVLVSATATRTPTETATRTETATVTLTRTPTVTRIPTLYAGEPEAGEPLLYFLSIEACEALRLPVSGGTPERLAGDYPLADCSAPAVSPDGQKIAFISAEDPTQLKLANVNGTGLRMVTKLAPSSGSGRSIWSFAWSPDGKSVAFVATGFTKDATGAILFDESFGYLYTVSLSNGYAKQMKAVGVDRNLSDALVWSPDSKWVFSFDKGDPQSVFSTPFAFRAADSRAVWITQVDSYLGYYDWSPDSMYLTSLVPEKPDTAALPADAPQTQEYIIISGLDETKHYIALDDKGYDPKFGARWFPDRSGFLLYHKASRRLVSVSEEGAMLQTIALLDSAPLSATWSPDGEWLALALEPLSGAGDTLMIVRPDGTDPRILSRDLGTARVVWG